MWLFRLLNRFWGWLRQWKFRMPDVDSHSWQNKDEVYNDLKSHYW